MCYICLEEYEEKFKELVYDIVLCGVCEFGILYCYLC